MLPGGKYFFKTLKVNAVASPYLAEMRKITKIFPGIKANDGVDFILYPGEIHCLLGENGSGKSTLMTVLSGLYHPDSGEILINGTPIVFRSPRDAIKAGIGMVHQHFKLVEAFTVAQNIVLGDKALPFIPQFDKVEREIKDLSERYGLSVNPRAKIWQLSVGERQRVEIVKMLYRGCDILVLDEPTAVLTPQETRELFGILREMAEQGKAVVVITHKLKEVLEIADRVTVLRKGRKVAEYKKGQFTEDELARSMVGKDFVSHIRKEAVLPGPEALRLVNVTSRNDSGGKALDSVSFCVNSGEIFGIAGVAGNGQRELAEVISGLRTMVEGKIYIDSIEMTGSSIRERIQAGVSLIPEDRLGTGLVPGLGLVENIMLKDYNNKDYTFGPFINWKACTAKANSLVSSFNIHITSFENPVRMLSGGNLQKLLLARELSSHPKVIVAVYPARGLDIAATETVHRLLVEERDKGAAVLLISEDLDEVLKLSDQIGVLYEGSLTGVIAREDANIEELGLMMMGSARREVAACGSGNG